tara:strand:- start:69 stop:242 length:174 start_codon:yes stop_codon:yes gene_type:complete
MDNNVQLKDLELFEYLMKRFNNMPHEALQTMISKKQDVKNVKVYFECMLDDINDYIK